MTNYAQNNFNDSAIAKGKESNKAMVILFSISMIALAAAFKFAIGN